MVTISDEQDDLDGDDDNNDDGDYCFYDGDENENKKDNNSC